MAEVESRGGKPDKQYRAVYAPVMIRSQTNSSWTPTLSLMDSGNTLTFACISQKKHEEMGLSHRATNATGRAATAQSLSIVGISEPLELKFASMNKTFIINPLVVQYLNSPLNLGSKFNFDNDISPQVPMSCSQSTEGRANFMRCGSHALRLYVKETPREQLVYDFTFSDPLYSHLVKKYSSKHKNPESHTLTSLEELNSDDEIEDEAWEHTLHREEEECQEKISRLANYAVDYDTGNNMTGITYGMAPLPYVDTSETRESFQRLPEAGGYKSSPKSRVSKGRGKEFPNPDNDDGDPNLVKATPLPYDEKTLDIAKNEDPDEFQYFKGENLGYDGLDVMKTMTTNYVHSLKSLSTNRPVCSVKGDNKKLVEALKEGPKVLAGRVARGENPPEFVPKQDASCSKLQSLDQKAGGGKMDGKSRLKDVMKAKEKLMTNDGECWST